MITLGFALTEYILIDVGLALQNFKFKKLWSHVYHPGIG